MTGAVVLALVLSFGGGHARAQDATETDQAAQDEARQLFDGAVTMLEAGRFAEAIDPLRRSLELFPNLPTAFNLAVALSRAGETLASIDLFEAILDGDYGDLSDTQRADAAVMLRAARAEVATLRIRASGAPAIRIHIDGQHVGDVVGGAELAWHVDAGEHLVGASAEGFAPAERAVTVRRGQRRRVTLEVGEAVPVAAQSAPILSVGPDPGAAEPRDEGGFDASIALWIGAGAAAIAGAVVAIVLLSAPAQADPVTDPVLPVVETLRY